MGSTREEQHERQHQLLDARRAAWMAAGGRIGDGFHVQRARSERRTFGLSLNGHLAMHRHTPKLHATFAELEAAHQALHEQEEEAR